MVEEFCKRLNELRTQKGISAREMSLMIGSNSGYINNIENNKSLPSMTLFFYICEYLGVTPQEFFDTNNTSPTLLHSITNDMKQLTPDQLELLSNLIKQFK